MAKIVLALGGNALGATPSQQRHTLAKTARVVVDYVAQGHQILICHGNGPQVGMIFNCFFQAAQSKQVAEPLSLYQAGAMSQGYIGFDIQNAVKNELTRRALSTGVVTLITQTLIDRHDAAFKVPSKPIGAFYRRQEAETLSRTNHWRIVEDAHRGYRRVVASPPPLDIIESSIISRLMATNVVIAGGGGGIPVFKNRSGALCPIDAVVDKDLTASKMAEKIKAEHFIILTAVSGVMLNFHTPRARALRAVTVSELERYLLAGQFDKGSMRPKVQAVINFTSNTGYASQIAHLNDADQVLLGKKGTKIYLQPRPAKVVT